MISASVTVLEGSGSNSLWLSLRLKIVISMLNCYRRKHLIYFMLFVALASRLVLNTLHSL
jgi:hypothetical protein